MKLNNQTVRFGLAFGFGFSLVILVGFGSVVQASAFEPVLFTFLVEAKEPLPEGPFVVVGLGSVTSDSKETIQVPGCTDGDMTSYPVQKIRFHNINKKLFTPGGSVSEMILSQKEPLPEGTHFQVFSLTQCTSGGQLYDKIEAGTMESIPFISRE